MNISNEIEKIIGTTPEELINYLNSGNIIKHDSSRINCLSFEEAKEYSEAVNDFPEGAELGLWVLDDANDSNPYCYISKGPCKGTVIHYCHDPEPKIKFLSLDSFLSSLCKAASSNIDIDDIEIDVIIRIDTESEIERILDNELYDLMGLAYRYIEVASSLNDTLIDKILNNIDYFLQESLALWLCNNINVKYLELAKVLSEHKMEQVSREAKQALSLINKLKYST